MLFNSFSFLIQFAILVILYYVIPHRFRWVLLLAASLYFYATFNVGFVLLLIGAALVAYLAGIGIGMSEAGTKKAILVVGVITSLAPLVMFKYYDFLADSVNSVAGGGAEGNALVAKLGWLLPVGLSFFTFACVSYIVDVYQGKLPAERNVGRLLLYVSFFPKLLMGPIERATTFLPQVMREVHFVPENVTAGLQLVLWGLFKKVVIADRLAVIVNAAYSRPQLTSPLDLLIATYFFAFQIYCDFSGYSDMAIGLARILGFNLMLNFRRPYLATSIVEFWGKERWHISLNKWFRDYMYFPMGGSRVPWWRYYINLLAVFAVSGLWHGANWTFVVWGLLNGVYQVITILTAGIRNRIATIIHMPPALGSILSGLLTFHLVLVSWVFFRASSFDDAQTVFTKMWTALPNLGGMLATLPNKSNYDEIILSVVLIVVLMLIELLDEHRGLWEGLRARPRVVRWAFYYALLAALVIFGKWGLTQFVYMQF